MISVFDLHCDLLSYLAGSSSPPTTPRSAYDTISRASIPALESGGVRGQVLAVYAPTARWSVRSGMRQIKIFQELPNRYPEAFSAGKIQTFLAIENASAIFQEEEPFEAGERRLRKLVEIGCKPLYVSLTWNGENRFGGGAHAQKVGLKADGHRLLALLNHHKIAVDLSHTSDRLAVDILNQNPALVLASHSNFRAVHNVPRNLPTEVAQEVILRGGIIGLNFIKPFLGEDETAIIRHIGFAIDNNLIDGLVLGADFYSEVSVPKSMRAAFKDMFFSNLASAADYTYLHALLSKQFSTHLLERLFSKRLFEFINRCYL